MKGKQITLYVGSNNKTGKLEDAKLKKILDKYLTGYSLDYMKGVWQGKLENSVVVDVINPTSQKQLDMIASEIARKLEQDVVLRVSDEISFKFLSAKEEVNKSNLRKVI